MSKTVEDRVIALCRYIENMTKMKVIRGKTPFTPQFKVPFVAVLVTAFHILPSDLSIWKTPEDDENGFVQKRRGLGQLELEIQGYGKGSLKALRRLTLSMPTDVWKMFEDENECGLSEKSELRDLSAAMEDAVFEERAGFTLNLYMSAPEEFDVDYYNKIDVTVIEKDKNFQVTETITATARGA